MNKLLLDVIKGNSLKKPIWLMRQAGRYLPEYRDLRKNSKNFLDFCYNSELAAEATLQPIRRFGFDASIIFSDILVIPDALGQKVEFIESKGPILGELDLERLVFNPKILEPVYNTIRIVKSNLPAHVTLIGFSGAPWTLACYMIEQKSSKDFSETKKFAYLYPDKFQYLLDKITDAVIFYLKEQIKAGAEVIQLFDSWTGVLNREQFIEYSVNPLKKISKAIRDEYPSIPIIGFPKGAGANLLYYKDYVDVISLDYTYPIEEAGLIGKVVQGNLDPAVLLSSKEKIKAEVEKILYHTRDIAHIFNLGHGILPSTPIENVEYLIELIRK